MEEEFSRELSSGNDLTFSGIIDAIVGREQGAQGIRLTLSHGVQQAAEQALAGQAGAVVALEPSTGEVLAFYSSPSFDPNLLVGESAQAGDGLAEDRAAPLLNRVVDQILAPGSSFKVITAAAASGKRAGQSRHHVSRPRRTGAAPGSTAVIPQRRPRDLRRPEQWSAFSQAFRRSCNTVFGQIGMDVGAELLGATADDFGFNDPIPFELPTVPSVFPTSSLEGDPPATAQSAIGQRDVQATPLQMAMVAAAVANDGVLLRPYVVSERFDRDLNILSQTGPVQLRRAVSPGTAAVLTELMVDAVAGGTGTAADIDGAEVGGKTGTSRNTRIPASCLVYRLRSI